MAKKVKDMILIIPAVLIALYQYIKNTTKEGPEALARLVAVFEVLVLLLTNFFSLFHGIRQIPMFLGWLAVLFVTILLTVKRFGTEGLLWNKKSPLQKKGVCGLLKKNERDWFIMTLLIVMGVLSLILLVGAIFTVPYNYDSMTYHLARIGHWLDNGSVAHYVSNVDRQIYSPVLAEYNLLQLMVLSQSDIFANLLQYVSLFVTAYFVYHCAARLGTNRRFALFGSFAFMLMPLTISQSITTQNDLFATMFLVIFLYELIGVVRWKQITLEKEQVITILLLASMVAFGYLAKTSVCASMLMFMPWLLIVCIIRKDKLSKMLSCALLAGAAILVLISETLLRTFLSSGSIMTNTASGDIMVATKNVSYILVNIMKNFSLLITQHLFRPLNGFVYRIAIGLGQLLHVEVNNEAIAFHGFDFLHHMNMGDDMYSHDKTPSSFVAYLAFLEGVLLVVLFIWLLLKGKRMSEAEKSEKCLSLGFAVSNWLSFGFIMALLRWQPWGTRLMYPALAATVIMSANLCYVFLKKKKWQLAVLVPLAALCVILAVSPLKYNMREAKAFIAGGCQDRLSYYFEFNQRRASYEALLAKAKEEKVTDIGVLINGDGYDYPLWLMFHQEDEEAVLRHIVAEDADRSIDCLGNENVAPEAILMVEREQPKLGDTCEYAGVTYVCTYVNEGNFDAYFSKSDN